MKKSLDLFNFVSKTNDKTDLAGAHAFKLKDNEVRCFYFWKKDNAKLRLCIEKEIK